MAVYTKDFFQRQLYAATIKYEDLMNKPYPADLQEQLRNHPLPSLGGVGEFKEWLTPIVAKALTELGNRELKALGLIGQEVLNRIHVLSNVADKLQPVIDNIESSLQEREQGIGYYGRLNLKDLIEAIEPETDSDEDVYGVVIRAIEELEYQPDTYMDMPLGVEELVKVFAEYPEDVVDADTQLDTFGGLEECLEEAVRYAILLDITSKMKDAAELFLEGCL